MTELWIRVHKEIIVNYEYFMRHNSHGLHIIKETYKYWYNTEQVKEFNGEECLEFPEYNKDGYAVGEIDIRFTDSVTVVLYYNIYSECLLANITTGTKMFGENAHEYDLGNNSLAEKIKRYEKRAILVGSNDCKYTTDGIHVLVTGGHNVKNVEGMYDCFGISVIGKRTKYVSCSRVEVGDIDDDTVIDYMRAFSFKNNTGKCLKINCLETAVASYINRRLYDAESIYGLKAENASKIDFKNMSRLKYLGTNTLYTESRFTYDFGCLDVDINREAVKIRGDSTLNLIAMNTKTLYRILYSLVYSAKFGGNMYGYAESNNNKVKVNATTSEMPEWADKMAAMIDGLHIRVVKSI